MILHATLAKVPRLPPSSQLNSTRHFMRELNRLGITSAIDAGGGDQNYPGDDAIIEGLHRRGQFRVPDEEIRGIESVLTVVGGKVVHGSGPFASHAPPGPRGHARLVAGGRLWRILRGRRPLGRGARPLGPLRSRFGAAGPPQTAAFPGPHPGQRPVLGDGLRPLGVLIARTQD